MIILFKCSLKLLLHLLRFLGIFHTNLRPWFIRTSQCFYSRYVDLDLIFVGPLDFSGGQVISDFAECFNRDCVFKWYKRLHTSCLSLFMSFSGAWLRKYFLCNIMHSAPVLTTHRLGCSPSTASVKPWKPGKIHFSENYKKNGSWQYRHKITPLSLADLVGRMGPLSTKISSFSRNFREKNGQIVGWCAILGVGKSWICHCLYNLQILVPWWGFEWWRTEGLCPQESTHHPSKI